MCSDEERTGNAVAEPLWEEQSQTLMHAGCGGMITFWAPDSHHDPTMARCPKCWSVWRRSTGWRLELD